MSPLDALAGLLKGRKIAVLTGAGCSTESGIPHYRGPGTRASGEAKAASAGGAAAIAAVRAEGARPRAEPIERSRARTPVQYGAFVGDPLARQRYWARAFAGWERFAGSRPNAAHHALARLERSGATTGLITQNVDRLHHAAGSRDVIELHGALAEVRCLECGAIEPRERVQARMRAQNAAFADRPVEMAPDGDAELADASGFVVPVCERCAGVLKPNVVFFGESVPKPIVLDAYARVDAADALLVVGSSLTVFSGYRFVLRARDRAMPIAIVNLGESRGDALAHVRVEARAGEVLPALVQALA